MAKTKRWTPRRVRDESERGSSSGFIRLDEGERFLGYALFEADPKKNDPGYYEFMQHWVSSGKSGTSVPCAGDDCPFCEDGDKPRYVALTTWLVSEDENGNDLGDGQLRIFQMNSLLIKQFTELRGESEKIKGRQFRVIRMDDRGNYTLMPKNKSMNASAVKELVFSNDAPDYDQMVTTKLNRAMEGIAVARAVEDTDDEDEGDNDVATKKPAASGTKGKAAAQEETGEWPETGEEILVSVTKVNSENSLFVSSEDYDGRVKLWGTSEIDVEQFSKGDELTVSYFMDEDDDLVLSEEPQAAVEEETEEDEDEVEEETDEEADEDEDESGEADLPDEIEAAELTVTSVDEAENTIEVESGDLGLAFTLYFLDSGPASKVDFADYKEGQTIIVSAEKDSLGDMVATVVPEVKSARKTVTRKTSSTGRKTATPKKTSAKPASRSTTKAKTSSNNASARKTTPKRTTTRRKTA